MTKKWCLIKSSDGARGANGRKKIYELILSDNNSLTAVWGMAEKSSRQTLTKSYGTQQSALWAAREQIDSKINKGYTLLYVA